MSCRSGKNKRFFPNFFFLYLFREEHFFVLFVSFAGDLSSNFLEMCELHSISSKFFFLFIQFLSLWNALNSQLTLMSYFRILFEKIFTIPSSLVDSFSFYIFEHFQKVCCFYFDSWKVRRKRSSTLADSQRGRRTWHHMVHVFALFAVFFLTRRKNVLANRHKTHIQIMLRDSFWWCSLSILCCCIVYMFI